MDTSVYEEIRKLITGKAKVPLYARVPRKYRFFIISVEEGTRYGSLIGEIPEEKPKKPSLWKRIFFAILGWIAGLILGYSLPLPFLFGLLGLIFRPFLRWIAGIPLSILGAYLGYNYDMLVAKIFGKRLVESRFINLAISLDTRDLRGLKIPSISLEDYLGKKSLREIIREISVHQVYSIYKMAWDRMLEYIKFLRRINLPRIGDVDGFLIVCMVSPRGLGAALSLAESIKESPHFKITGERIFLQLIWPSEKQRPHLAGILGERANEIYEAILKLEGFCDAVFHADEEAISGYRRFAFIAGAKGVNRLQRAYEIISTLGDKTRSKPADFDASLTSKGEQKTPHLTFCIDDLPTREITALEILARHAIEVLQVPLTKFDLEKIYLISCYFLCSPEEYHIAVPEALKALEQRARIDVMMCDAIEEPESKFATTLEVVSLPREAIYNIASLIGKKEEKVVEKIEEIPKV